MIRLAEPADLDTVAALLCAFRDWWGSASPSDETFRATAEILLRDPNTEFLLAGTSGLTQLRYTGLGRALVEAALERARARGCKRIELDVQESNEHAIGLYVKCGFSVHPKGTSRTLFLSAKL